MKLLKILEQHKRRQKKKKETKTELNKQKKTANKINFIAIILIIPKFDWPKHTS